MINLNKTGLFLWELLAEERSEDELTAAITKHFNVEHKEASLGVQTFVGEISGMGLVE